MLASVGHLYGFGNTLDKALTAVVGCKRRSVAVRWTDRSTTRLERDGSKTTPHAYQSVFLFLMRTNWVTNKQTVDGSLRAAAVEGARTA